MLVFLTFSFTYTSRQDYPEVEISVKAERGGSVYKRSQRVL